MDNLPSAGRDQGVQNNKASIDIVIVNWNAGHQLSDCLASLVKSRAKIARVIVIDNASTDGSAENLDRFDLPLSIARNNENAGFARACNQGASMGDAPYLLFLNPDTRVFQDSIERPLAFLESGAGQRAGVCGIQLLDESGRISRTCARFPSLMRFAAQALGLNKLPGLRSTGVHMAGWDHGETRTVDHVIGAFYLVRRSLFRDSAGFDERFFVYLEDVDFSYRARGAGFESVYLAGAQAFHAGGGSSRQILARRLFYSLRSRLLYALKHFSRWKAVLTLIVTVIMEPVARVLFSLGRGNVADVRNTVRAYSLLFSDLPKILRTDRMRRFKRSSDDAKCTGGEP